MVGPACGPATVHHRGKTRCEPTAPCCSSALPPARWNRRARHRSCQAILRSWCCTCPPIPRWSRLASLEAALRTDPDNTARIYALTDAYIAIGRRTGEPRYFGRAEVLLTAAAAEAVRTSRTTAATRPTSCSIGHEYERALEQIFASTGTGSQQHACST